MRPGVAGSTTSCRIGSAIVMPKRIENIESVFRLLSASESPELHRERGSNLTNAQTDLLVSSVKVATLDYD